MSARRKVEGAGGREKWNGEQSKQKDLLGEPINHFRPPTSPLLLPPPLLFSFNFIFLLYLGLCLLSSPGWKVLFEGSGGQSGACSHNLLVPLIFSCPALILHLHLVLRLELCPSSLPLPSWEKVPRMCEKRCANVCRSVWIFQKVRTNTLHARTHTLRWVSGSYCSMFWIN